MARRAVMNGAGQPLRLENYDLPDVPDDFVRIRVAYSGVCHSDLHLREDNGKSFGLKLRDALGEEAFNKIVMGHEISGYVDEMGSESNAPQMGFKKGDRVAVYPWLGCQNCSVCALDTPNFCSSPAMISFCLGCGPEAPGGYATHVIVPAKFLVKVPENIPMDTASLLTCSGGTVLSAMKKLRQAVEFGAQTSKSGLARLLILGAGGLGLWAVKFAKVLYKDKVHVMVAEIDHKKIVAARDYGADEGILWNRENTEEQNVALAIKDGKVHAVADFIGNPGTVSTGSKCLVRNGSMVMVGIQGGVFSLPIPHVVLSGISLLGNLVFSLTEMQEVVDLVSKNNITYPNIRHFALDEVNTALDLLDKGQITGRAVLKQD